MPARCVPGNQVNVMNEELPQVEEASHEELERLLALLRRHGGTIALAVCVALVAAGGGIFYRRHAAAKTEKAAMMLASSRTVQELENIVKDYPSSGAAPLALLKAAKGYFDSGSYDMALKKYDEFRENFADHQMEAAARLGRAHCLEARGQVEDALLAFIAFSTGEPGHFLAPQAVFGQGRCLEQLGRMGEARTVYEDFIAANQDSNWLPLAEEMLETVNRKIERGPIQPAAAPFSPESQEFVLPDWQF